MPEGNTAGAAATVFRDVFSQSKDYLPEIIYIYIYVLIKSNYIYFLIKSKIYGKM